MATDDTGTAERVRHSLDSISSAVDSVPSYAAQVLRRLSVSSVEDDKPPLDQDVSPARQALLRAAHKHEHPRKSWYDTLWSTLGYSTAPEPHNLAQQQRQAIPAVWRSSTSSSSVTTVTDTFRSASESTVRGARDGSETATGAQSSAADDDAGASHVSTDDDEQEVQKTARRILYRAPPPLTSAGDETPSLLVFVAANVPSRDEVSHEKLLNVLQQQIDDEAATGTYDVLAVLNPNPNPPTWSQIISLYWTTSRQAHKNVGKITIVGGGWWLSVTLTLVVATLVSPKSAGKIRQCSNLSRAAAELAQEQFQVLDLPLECYMADYDLEKTISLPKSWQQRRLFGTSLNTLMTSDEPESLPQLVTDCLRVLREQGTRCSGIFRRSPSAKKVAIYQGLYEREQPVHLDDIDDGPFIAASLLRSFIGALPDPVFTDAMYQPAQACPPPSAGSAASQAVRETVVPLLGTKEQILLRQVTTVLHEIALHKRDTLMDSSSLAICIMPSLLGKQAGTSIRALESCRVPSATGASGRNTLAGVLSTMIERHDEVFAT
ncbi:hypothetical protein ACM66B_003414 [Microbotryomycetes sp. NB124-2]